MDVNVTVSDEMIFNLLCSANYGAISYWVESMEIVRGGKDPDRGWNDPIGHTEAAPLAGGCWRITSEAFDEQGYSAPGTRTDTLDREACERGIRVMAAKYPRHFADLVTENDDAITADVFVQCALFGDLVYG